MFELPAWIGIAGFVVLLVANAFFVAAEFAVISARRSAIEPLQEKGTRGAAAALWAMEHATLMLATTQLGITVCSLFILEVSEPTIHHLFVAPLNGLGVEGDVGEVIIFVLALVVVSFLHVVLGEMVPKNLSFSYPERAVVLLAPPLVALGRAFAPVTKALQAASNGVVRVFGITPRNETVSTFSLEEVETIVEHSRREGVLADASGTIAKTFDFSTTRAGALAIPLNHLVHLPHAVTTEMVEHAVTTHGFSRYLIDDDGGQVIGYVHVKDVLDLEDAPREPLPPERIRPLMTIGSEADLEETLAFLRRGATHVARVVRSDAPSVTLGVIFLEDVIEELVGEVRDAASTAERQDENPEEKAREK